MKFLPLDKKYQKFYQKKKKFKSIREELDFDLNMKR